MKENFAVIQLGGSQHLVSVGDQIEVNRIDKKVGESFKIDEVLLYNNGKETFIGDPYVPYTVVAQVDSHLRGKKLDVLKYKAKARYRRKIGHRQDLSIVMISKISKKTS